MSREKSPKSETPLPLGREALSQVGLGTSRKAGLLITSSQIRRKCQEIFSIC